MIDFLQTIFTKNIVGATTSNSTRIWNMVLGLAVSQNHLPVQEFLFLIVDN